MKVSLLGFLAIISVNADDPLCAGLPPDQEVLFPSVLHCNHYYKCLNGVFTEEICETGLYFSPTSNRCVEAEYAECNGGSGAPEPTTPSPTTPPTPPPITTTSTTPTPTIPTGITSTGTTPDAVDPRCSDNETSYWPHPNYCHLYIECYQGNSFEMVCPADKYFSDIHKQCVLAEESECCTVNQSQCV